MNIFLKMLCFCLDVSVASKFMKATQSSRVKISNELNRKHHDSCWAMLEDVNMCVPIWECHVWRISCFGGVKGSFFPFSSMALAEIAADAPRYEARNKTPPLQFDGRRWRQFTLSPCQKNLPTSNCSSVQPRSSSPFLPCALRMSAHQSVISKTHNLHINSNGKVQQLSLAAHFHSPHV